MQNANIKMQNARKGNSPMVRTLILLASIATTVVAGPSDSVCARAEYMFFNRHLNATWLDSAYNMMDALHQADPKNEHYLYLWSRVHIQKGDDARTKAEKLRNFARAKALAETLIALNDRNDEGHCWWGVAQGRIGQTRGVLNSLFMVSGLKKAFSRATELNPKHPTALDAYGVLYYELPGFVGGDLARSEQYFRRSIESAPNYTLARLDLAKVYIKQKRWSAARTQLDTLLATTDALQPADTELDDKPEARQLLKQIEGKQ
jgi:tetratricopeptide (TPR) repeat protein